MHKIIDVRKMSLESEYELSKQYPPCAYEQFGISHVHRLVTDADIVEFSTRCKRENAVIQFISNYGQYAYKSIE